MSTLQSNTASYTPTSLNTSLTSKSSTPIAFDDLTVESRLQREVSEIYEEISKLTRVATSSPSQAKRLEVLAEQIADALALGKDFLKLSAMLRNLQASDHEIRRRAVHTIDNEFHSPSADTALLSATYDKNARVRAGACLALGSRAGKRIGVRLAEILGDEDEDPAIRRAAASGMRIQASRIALPAIESAIENADLADSATASLEKHTSTESVNLLRKILNRDELGVNDLAFFALGRHNTPIAADLLLECIAKPEQGHWLPAVMAIEKHTHTHAIEKLREYVQKSNRRGLAMTDKVKRILEALEKMDPTEVTDHTLLIKILRRSETFAGDVRYMKRSLKQLQSFNPSTQEHILRTAATNVNASVRASAYSLLSSRADSSISQFLVDRFRDENLAELGSPSRAAIKEAILCQRAEDVVPLLIPILEDSGGERRMMTATLLSFFQDSAASVALIRSFNSEKDQESRRFLLGCLGDQVTPEARTFLIKTVQESEDAFLIEASLRKLQRHHTHEVDKLFRQVAANSDDPNARIEAINGLKTRVDPLNTETLLLALRDTTELIQCRAAQSLAEHRCQAATEGLRRLYHSTSSEDVRSACKHSLASHGYPVP